MDSLKENLIEEFFYLPFDESLTADSSRDSWKYKDNYFKYYYKKVN